MFADKFVAAAMAAAGGPNGAIGGPDDIGGITGTGITAGTGIAGKASALDR
jgi:hypothetical protein